jgi:hypothetical protein
MGDWTAHIHARLSRIEEQLFGAEEATAIAEASPKYDATTEAATTADLPVAAETPAETPAGDASADPSLSTGRGRA